MLMFEENTERVFVLFMYHKQDALELGHRALLEVRLIFESKSRREEYLFQIEISCRAMMMNCYIDEKVELEIETKSSTCDHQKD